MNRQVVISSGLLITILICELLFWNHIFLITFIYILLAYLKHKLYPIKKEWLWYLLIVIGGTIAEVILVNLGKGWTYVNPNILGIPIWIPFFWGVVGTTSIVLYEGLTTKHSENKRLF